MSAGIPTGRAARRAKRARQHEGAPYPATLLATVPEPVRRARATWAKLIRKVYEADPLTCPQCQAKMRVIALIDDPHVIRRILEHLGRWAPLPAQRSPPAQDPDWPPGATIPLTYHPLPDIA